MKKQRSSIKRNPGYRQREESTRIYTSIRSFQWEQCLLRAKGRSETDLWDLITFFSSCVPKKDDFQHLILLFHLNQLSVTNLFSPAADKTSEFLGRLKCLTSTPTICYTSFSKFILTNQLIPHSYHPSFFGFNAFCTFKYSHFLSIFFLILWARKSVVLFHLAAFQLT